MQMRASGGHQCQYCVKMYIDKDKLDQHVRTKHVGECVGQCDICHKTFQSIDGYRSPMKTHQDDLKSECLICALRFVNDSTLRKHLRIHSSKKSFNCGECGKQFKHKYSLKRRSCKLFNESPLHVCGLCKLIFRSSTELIEHHELQHKGMNYVCNICGNSYQWHQSLTRHEHKCLGLDMKGSADCLHEADRDVDSGFKMTETGLGLIMTETGLGLANANVIIIIIIDFFSRG